MPVWQGKRPEKDVSRCATLIYKFRVGTVVKGWTNGLFDVIKAFGAYDYFDKPWKEIVDQNGPYFSGGQISMEVKTRVPRKEE